MRVVLLRVGIDSGAGGIQGPLLEGGAFEYIPIPDGHGLDSRTYGNTVGRHGRVLVDYFPERLRAARRHQAMHVDPEFETFTYGDPGGPKQSLRRLVGGDLLVFYAGLQRWSPDIGFHPGTEGLYVIGYFEVELACWAGELDDADLQRRFAANAHIRAPSVLDDQRDRLVLVKGGPGSRLLERAVLISEWGTNRVGQPLKILSTPMRDVFGGFGGRVSLQRSPPRWVDSRYVGRAADFVRSLP